MAVLQTGIVNHRAWQFVPQASELLGQALVLPAGNGLDFRCEIGCIEKAAVQPVAAQ